MNIRQLVRAEIAQMWQIDRSEVSLSGYQLQNGKLVLIDNRFDLRDWPQTHIEKTNPLLYACYDRGGLFIAGFDGPEIVGIAVLDNIKIGTNGDCLQLNELYVSQGHRRTGLGRQLLESAKTSARDFGARYLYISATPTRNTVDFYLHNGCTLAMPPDPKLLALEPDDIHLICSV